MNQKPKRRGWGGARAGAGRPKLDTETIRLTLRRDTARAVLALGRRPSAKADAILRAGLGLPPADAK